MKKKSRIYLLIGIISIAVLLISATMLLAEFQASLILQ